MASSVTIALNPLTAAVAVLLVIAAVNRPRLTVFVAVVLGAVFVVARRLRRRQGMRGAIREQIAQIRDNGFMERSLIADLDRALDLFLDEYIIDRFLGPAPSSSSLSSRSSSTVGRRPVRAKDQ